MKIYELKEKFMHVLEQYVDVKYIGYDIYFCVLEYPSLCMDDLHEIEKFAVIIRIRADDESMKIFFRVKD